ncbi:hypothetical protein [Nitrosopumilus sp.]|nr:hypothetical protein [Nitrosopumilus sp.]
MDEDVDKELRETEQEIMIELKLKTNEFLKKFKEHANKNRVKMDNI